MYGGLDYSSRLSLSLKNIPSTEVDLSCFICGVTFGLPLHLAFGDGARAGEAWPGEAWPGDDDEVKSCLAIALPIDNGALPFQYAAVLLRIALSDMPGGVL